MRERDVSRGETETVGSGPPQAEDLPAGSVPAEEFSRRRRSLNGVFRRFVGDIKTTPFDMDSAHFYRVGKVLYRINDQEGFIAERKASEAISYAIRITHLRKKAVRLFPKLREEYRSKRDNYTTDSFWKELLDY